MKIDKELVHKVDTFNEYEDGRTMQVVETSGDYYTLYIDNQEITSGDECDIAQRVTQILRENGLIDFL